MNLVNEILNQYFKMSIETNSDWTDYDKNAK